MNNFCESCKASMQQDINLFQYGECTTEGNLCWYLDEKGNTCLKQFYIHNQPERSKREDFVLIDISDKQFEHAFKKCSTEMRCSEHCGNTVRGK